MRYLHYVLMVVCAIALSTYSPRGVAQSLEVIASVDKNPIVQGEPFTLTVTVNDEVAQSAWDPETSLRDFRVLNTRSSRRTSVINGVSSRTTSFVVSLQAPSTPGIVRIPPITIEGASSDAIELTILDAQSAADQLEQRPAFIRTSLESTEVYVQQQFKLIARLYLSANLHSGNIVAPTLESAEVRQFGKDEESYEIINGKRYQVFQRTYLITPQRSGELTIEGPLFEGQISRERSRSVFSSIATTQPVSTIAPPTTLNVLPRPESWQGHWLPAELVSISAEHVDPTQSISVGQPITLTYRVTAIGVAPEQLPRISLNELENASIYPEAPELSSTVRNGRMVAQRTQAIAIIPREPGQLTIPPVKLQWFNTRLGQAQTAATDELSFTIEPAQGLQQDLSHTRVAAATPESSLTETELPTPTPLVRETTPHIYQILAMVFAGLWLTTIGLWAWWWSRQQRTKTQPLENEAKCGWALEGATWRDLEVAAKANDAAAVDKTLRRFMAWNYFTHRINDLNDIARVFNYPPLTSQIDHLQRSRYAGKALSWQEGKALLRALKAATQEYQKSAKPESKLQPLYPETKLK